VPRSAPFYSFRSHSYSSPLSSSLLPRANALNWGIYAVHPGARGIGDKKRRGGRRQSKDAVEEEGG